MKRKAQVIDLDDEDVFDGDTPYIVSRTSYMDMSRSPPHRLASLALSDSSRTMSPEPQLRRSLSQASPPGRNATSCEIIPHQRDGLQDAYPIPSFESVTSDSRRNIDGDTSRPTPTSRRQIINLDDEVVEIQPVDWNEVEVIDVDELESELERDIFQREVEDEYEDLAVRDVSKRNGPIRAPLRKMDKVIYRRGEYLRPGDTVELNDGRFLEIKTIVENVQTRSLVLRGWELRRTKDLDGEIGFKLNEVCYIFDMDLDDPRPMREQCIITVSFEDIKKIRRLTRTNYHFPAYRFDNSHLPPGDNHTKRRYAIAKEGLVVRWQYITTFETAKDREHQPHASANFTSRKLVRLDKQDCNDNCHIPQVVLRCQWRDEGTPEESPVSGDSDDVITSSNNIKNPVCLDDSDNESLSYPKERCPKTPNDTGVLIHISAHDFENPDPRKFQQTLSRRYYTKLNSNEQGEKNIGGATRTQRKKRRVVNVKPATTRKKTKQYRYGDAFCGAGGATRGAVMAGLKVVWGLDFNPNAAATWRYNFPQAKMYEMWADTLCGMPDTDGKLIVDVLHLSPPCQVWSPAHTVAGKDDDMNFASLYAVQELIAKAKPRFVTLEQTFGIIHRRFRNPFNNLIRMFTDHNFSVGWQIVKLERLGLPQRRKRLIIFAAAPGETLPPLPEYTHSRYGGNGLKAFSSAQSALSSIPANAANHEIPQNAQGRYIPWDASNLLPNCITTTGANGRGHPSGRRGLTCRETASLQTFPHNHVFRGLAIRKQIGNAVPPLIGRLLFSSVKKHMEEVDAEETKGLE